MSDPPKVPVEEFARDDFMSRKKDALRRQIRSDRPELWILLAVNAAIVIVVLLVLFGVL